MKKTTVFSLICIMFFIFLLSCRAKQEEIILPPPLPESTGPPTPQAKEQPKIEKVEIPKELEEPKGVREERPVREYELTEEEIFLSKSLEEMNREAQLETIHFDYDEYYIRADAKPVLEVNAAWLKKFPSIKILIEGHCDERGTEEYNLALGERRANSTFDYLVSLGINPDRIKIISYGKSQPLEPGHNEFAWQRNRRAQFVIIGK